jgi:hypothetical protein
MRKVRLSFGRLLFNRNTPTMKQNLILTIFCLTFFACNTTTEKKDKVIDNSKITKKVIGKKFFEFDAINYYLIDFDESKIGDLYDNQSKSEIDSFKMGIILGDLPKNISDLSFIDKLKKIGYKKKSVDKSKFDEIDKIFVEKTVKENDATACIYVYRDILIFKKNNAVVGTAKICFGCMANKIIGTNANTENFGMDGDYEKLEDLLRK